MIVAVEETCFSYTALNQEVSVEAVDDLKCQHEEADTRMVFHLYHVAKDPDQYVSIRSNDTDVLILLLYHLPKKTNTPYVWMDVGLSANNSRRYINVNQIADTMDGSLLDALPGFHSFTGSDCTCAFMNKGKSRPYDLMETSPNHVGDTHITCTRCCL